MIKKNSWGLVLLLEIFFLVFLTGFFPETTYPILFPLLYSALYLTAAAGLEENKRIMLWVALGLLVAQIVFRFFDLMAIEAVSKALNFVFFSYIVISLIRQIASAQLVTKKVIVGSINGYLLLGLVYTFLIGLLIQFDSQSFNFSTESTTQFHDSMYFGFITFATLGYGDFVPLKPYAKSLSIFIAVSGQLYVAVIIALLVGKFSTQIGKS